MAGNRSTPETIYKTYPIKGLDCADCAGRLERAINRDKALSGTSINFAAARIRLPAERFARVQAVIDSIEPGVVIEETNRRPSASVAAERYDGRFRLIRIVVTLLLTGGGMLFGGTLRTTPYGWAEYAVFLSAYLLIGAPVLAAALRNLGRGLLMDENFLMSLATIGAIAIHELPEAVGVMLFYSVGEYFQNRAVNDSRRSVTALLESRPDTATRKSRGKQPGNDGPLLETVHPSEIAVGETILVKPGERIPLDGRILEGTASLDTSALTGESVPRKRGEGNEVLAGMVCLDGLLTIKVSRTEAESSIARILHLVEDAAGRKAPTEQFITTFSRYYTPAVVFISLAIALLPPLLIDGALFSDWLYRALTILVISCPCALVISIPLSYFGGLGGASRRGILIKGANYLEALTKVQTVALDKTGTVTRGSFELTEILPAHGVSPERVLTLAAVAEAHSSHPIAAAIRRASTTIGSSDGLSNYTERPGRGLAVDYDGESLLVGNRRLFEEYGVPLPANLTANGFNRIHVASNRMWIGSLTIADQLKPGSPALAAALKIEGVTTVALLSGDVTATVAAVAGEMGIDTWNAELLPEQKVEIIEQLAVRSKGTGKLLFAGDGINDAPVLARADIGVAMGGLGSEAAIEAADVVIIDDDPHKIVEAIQIARRTRRIVFQNIMLALGVKLVFIALGTIGIATMWEAVIADVGVALAAILNATRALATSSRV